MTLEVQDPNHQSINGHRTDYKCSDLSYITYVNELLPKTNYFHQQVHPFHFWNKLSHQFQFFAMCYSASLLLF